MIAATTSTSSSTPTTDRGNEATNGSPGPAGAGPGGDPGRLRRGARRAGPTDAVPAAPGGRTTGPGGTPLRSRRVSTPLLLRAGMVLALVPVTLFVVAVQLGVARNDDTVRTVGHDATRGITVAQELKLNLAELDQLVVRDLVGPVVLSTSGFPQDYDDKREALHDTLVLAAAQSPPGAAYRQPLVNIDYVLAHYHALVKDAFAASAAGDLAGAADVYGRAHDVMDQTLLAEADFVDKANTYVLNDSYDTQTARSASTLRLIVASWVVLLAFLVIVQLLLVRRFRRLLNPALVAATIVVVMAGAFVLARLDQSKADLATARNQAFDSVHELAKARATVASARQAEGQMLLGQGGELQASAGFDAQAERLFRVQGGDDAAELARAGTVPEGAGGYLAAVVAAESEGDAEADDADFDTIVRFGEYVAADEEMRRLVTAGDLAGAVRLYDEGGAFDVLTEAIDEAQLEDQARFDRFADSAAEASSNVGELTTAAAAGALLLVLLGLYRRLREYRT